MSSFFTRPNLGQFQPQAASLPFSQFGGQRPQLQGDTTGGIAFPNAGQQPAQSPLSQFLLPTGLSQDELRALLRRGDQPEALGGSRLELAERSLFTNPFLSQQQSQPTGSLTGAIPFEGGGSPDKFNPVLAGGTSVNNINLLQSPTTSTTTNLLNKNLLGGF